MIVTVTTSTVTTVSTIAAVGLSTVIGVIAVFALVVFLATRELASTGNSRFSMRITKAAGVGILPLVMTFAVIIATQIIGMF